MPADATLFVAMPMSELVKLISNMLDDRLLKFHNQLIKPQEETLMTIEEVSSFLKVSKVTIHKWKKRKLIKSHRIGRRIYFKKQELIATLK